MQKYIEFEDATGMKMQKRNRDEDATSMKMQGG